MSEFLTNILREPDELLKSLNYSLGPGRNALDEAVDLVNKHRDIWIVGIGSSWHAGMAMCSMMRSHGRTICLAEASDFLHFATPARGSTIITLSRSGKSVEIVEMLNKVKELRCHVVAVTNTPSSPLGRKAAVTLDLAAEFDHNVSVTMYSALAMTGCLLISAALGELNDELANSLRNSISSTGALVDQWRAQAETSEWFTPEATTYMLARAGSMSTASETRLLWEEAVKHPATALMTGSFRHGPQEVVSEGMRVILWFDALQMRQQDMALSEDLRRLGVKVLAIGQELPDSAGDLAYSIPTIPGEWQFITDCIPAQIAAERLARMRGVDCDSFRLCPYVVDGEGGLL